ncbi:Magnesium and cobalt efflux protein CorC [compost metagenome]
MPVRGERYRVLATTSIDDFNDFFECALPDDEVDTIGGLVTANLGYVPVRGEGLQLQDWHFTVIRADSRRLQALLVERRPQADR